MLQTYQKLYMSKEANLWQTYFKSVTSLGSFFNTFSSNPCISLMKEVSVITS